MSSGVLTRADWGALARFMTGQPGEGDDLSSRAFRIGTEDEWLQLFYAGELIACHQSGVLLVEREGLGEGAGRARDELVGMARCFGVSAFQHP